MMPLSMVNTGETGSIKQVGGKADTRRFLESLGFVPGCTVTVVSKINGSVIVHIKEARVAISREMANKILV